MSIQSYLTSGTKRSAAAAELDVQAAPRREGVPLALRVCFRDAAFVAGLLRRLHSEAKLTHHVWDVTDDAFVVSGTLKGRAGVVEATVPRRRLALCDVSTAVGTQRSFVVGAEAAAAVRVESHDALTLEHAETAPDELLLRAYPRDGRALGEEYAVTLSLFPDDANDCQIDDERYDADAVRSSTTHCTLTGATFTKHIGRLTLTKQLVWLRIDRQGLHMSTSTSYDRERAPRTKVPAMATADDDDDESTTPPDGQCRVELRPDGQPTTARVHSSVVQSLWKLETAAARVCITLNDRASTIRVRFEHAHGARIDTHAVRRLDDADDGVDPLD